MLGFRAVRTCVAYYGVNLLTINGAVFPLDDVILGLEFDLGDAIGSG